MDNLNAPSNETPITFSAAEVADLLGVELHDLKNWRALPDGHPRQLLSAPMPGRHRYEAQAVYEWLQRPTNTRYREVILASFVPDAVRRSLFPLTMNRHNQQIPMENQQ